MQSSTSNSTNLPEFEQHIGVEDGGSESGQTTVTELWYAVIVMAVGLLFFATAV